MWRFGNVPERPASSPAGVSDWGAVMRLRRVSVRVVVGLLAVIGGPCAASASDAAVARVVASAKAHALAADSLPSLTEVRAACGPDAVCAGRLIAGAAGDGARLVRAIRPNPDSIRWVDTRPSVVDVQIARAEDGGVLRRVVVDRFGPAVVDELRRAVTGDPAATAIEIDLRCNAGGNVGRMLAAVALFTGPVRAAAIAIDPHNRRPLAVPAPAEVLRTGPLGVVVGLETAGSGELMAALLRRYARARIFGRPTAGRLFLLRTIPLNHEWSLRLPSSRIEVPGGAVAGGLQPDVPLPASAAACAKPVTE